MHATQSVPAHVNNLPEFLDIVVLFMLFMIGF